MVTDFRISFQEEFATHAVVQVEVSPGAACTKVNMIRKIGCLADMWKEQEAKKKTEDVEPKAAEEAKKEEDERLKAAIAGSLEDYSTKLRKATEAEDTDALWRWWSIAVEKGWLSAIEHLEDRGRERLRGRGTFCIHEEDLRTPKKKDEDDLKTMKAVEAAEATRHLKHARRCTRLAENLGRLSAPLHELSALGRARYIQESTNIFRKLKNQLRRTQPEEDSFINKFRNEGDAVANTLRRPVFQNQARWHQAQFEKLSSLAKEDERKRRKQRSEEKAKGIKYIGQGLAARRARPFLAIVRDEVGPEGQPVGSITTSLSEIDKITTRAWSKVYKGAKGDRAKRAADYKMKYGNTCIPGPLPTP